MTHFVSASCEGNLCSVCKAPARHKLGEEIQADEPCPVCSCRWKLVSVIYHGDGGEQIKHHKRTPEQSCDHVYHDVIGTPRHNLTAYVCCAHYVMIVGTAGGCPPGDVMKAGIWREAAATNRILKAENSELRDAVIDVCDDWNVHRNGYAYIRELRFRANRTGEAFNVETIRNRAADVVRMLEAIVEKTSAMAESNAAHAELAKAVHGIAAILLGKS